MTVVNSVAVESVNMTVETAIRTSYLAQGLTDEQIALLVNIAFIREFLDGQSIVEQFDENRDLMILAEGQANIYTVTDDVIGVVKPCMPMGEVSFLDDKPRSARVVSVGTSKVVVLPSHALRTLLDENLELKVRALVNLSRVLCHRLRNVNNHLAALMVLEESN